MKTKVNGLNNSIEITRGNEKDEVFKEKLLEEAAKGLMNNVKMVFIAEEEPSKMIIDVCKRGKIEIKVVKEEKEQQSQLFTIRQMWNNDY